MQQEFLCNNNYLRRKILICQNQIKNSKTSSKVKNIKVNSKKIE